MLKEFVTPNDLEKFKDRIVAEITAVFEKEKSIDLSKKWLRSNEVMRLMKISNSTLQNLRDTGQIPFSKFGNSIYYDRDDLNEILMSNKNVLRANNKI